MTKKLYRSRTDSVLAGVCGGIAKYFDLDATIVRIVTFLLFSFGGLSLFIYVVLAIVIPKEPIGNQEYSSPKPSPESFSGSSTTSSPGSERRAPVLDGGKSSLDDLQPQNTPRDSSRKLQLGVLLIIVGVVALILGRWGNTISRMSLLSILLIVLGIMVMTGRKGFR